jgi:hypothetical protein
MAHINHIYAPGFFHDRAGVPRPGLAAGKAAAGCPTTNAEMRHHAKRPGAPLFDSGRRIANPPQVDNLPHKNSPSAIYGRGIESWGSPERRGQV